MKRSGPLKRTTPLRAKSRLRPVSKRRQAEAPERRAVVAEVIARDGGCVPARRGMPGACRGPLTAHEIVKRSQRRGAHLDPANCVASCWLHNGMIEDMPRLARDLGLVRSAWENNR